MTCPIPTCTICTQCIFYTTLRMSIVCVIASSHDMLPTSFLQDAFYFAPLYLCSVLFPHLLASSRSSFFLFSFSFLPLPCPSSHRSSPAPSLLIPLRPSVFLSTLPPPLPSLIFILYFPFSFQSLLSFRVARYAKTSEKAIRKYNLSKK